jgi:hypothetical protein
MLLLLYSATTAGSTTDVAATQAATTAEATTAAGMCIYPTWYSSA